MGSWGSKKNVDEPKRAIKSVPIKTIEPVSHVIKLDKVPVRKQPKLNLIKRDLPPIVSVDPDESNKNNDNKRHISKETKELIMEMKK